MGQNYNISQLVQNYKHLPNVSKQQTFSNWFKTTYIYQIGQNYKHLANGSKLQTYTKWVKTINIYQICQNKVKWVELIK